MLEVLTDEWQHAPLWAMGGTLITLEKRGLIERRVTPGMAPSSFMYSTKSAAYQWRKCRQV